MDRDNYFPFCLCGVIVFQLIQKSNVRCYFLFKSDRTKTSKDKKYESQITRLGLCSKEYQTLVQEESSSEA